MKTMWYAIAWSRVIGRVHVSGETEHTLHVVGGNGKTRVHRKRTDFAGYFDAWDEAKQFLLDHAERDVAAARRQLELANAKLGNVKGMRRPDDAQEAG